MSRACVCGGSNENCRYCGGLGTIEDTLATALVAYAHRPETKKIYTRAPVPRPKWMSGGTPVIRVPCPEGCGALLKPSKVSVHVQKVHAVGAAAVVPKPQGGLNSPSAIPHPAPVYGQCPICKAKVKLTRWTRHLSKPHSPVAFRAWEAGALPPSAKEPLRDTTNLNAPAKKNLDSRPVFGQCPICKVKVKFTRLNHHIIKAHRRVAIGAGIAPHSAQDSLRNTTSFVAPREKNLDVTKPYAHAYRETGRYGSHPSHDGFDDESGPE